MGMKRKLARRRRGPSLTSQINRETRHAGSASAAAAAQALGHTSGPKADPASWGGNPRPRKQKRRR